MATNEHSKFRATKLWKDFRLEQIKANDNTCECCGRSYKQASHLQLHHLVPNEYENLDPNNFAVLCSLCHKNVELLASKKSWEGMNKIYLTCFMRFVPLSEQKNL